MATEFYFPWRQVIALGGPSYGLLYNWYASTDVRNIANTGWHVSNLDDWKTLMLYLDPATEILSDYSGSEIAGSALKETGTIYWSSPNSDATNSVKFNGRGSGYRGYDTGFFYDEKDSGYFWLSDLVDGYGNAFIEASDGFMVASTYDDSFYVDYRKYGDSIRLVKDSTILTHGQTGTYTGNDGKVYSTICIGTQEWLSRNLVETKYRNGDSIPEVTNDAAWIALTDGALCAYENNWDNI